MTHLEQLPGRIDDLTLQMVQLRGEMHAVFSASERSLREEIRAAEEKLRSEIRAGDDETRREMRELHQLTVKSVDELRAQMLMLHEHVISQFALIQEGRPRRGKRR